MKKPTFKFGRKPKPAAKAEPKPVPPPVVKAAPKPAVKAPAKQTPEAERVTAMLLEMAANPNSELYLNGQRRRGSALREAFWDGAEGEPCQALGVGPLAAYFAGQQWAKGKA